MSNGIFTIPPVDNEPVLSYGPGTPEKAALKSTLEQLYNSQMDIPMHIGGMEVRTDKKIPITPPHDHQHVIGHYSEGTGNHVEVDLCPAVVSFRVTILI